jgi:protein-export membrane protein SecD
MDALAKTIYDQQGLATRELRDLYAKTGQELDKALLDQQVKFQETLKAAAETLGEKLRDIKADFEEDVAELKGAYGGLKSVIDGVSKSLDTMIGKADQAAKAASEAAIKAADSTRSAIGEITGQPTTESANDLALLLRAGSLAAPMEIIEERTIGPSLGAENIEKGFTSLIFGFIAIAIFMIVYYMLFGFFSVTALAVNIVLLISLLSMLQATLSLPGIAAMALALGMAIDSNVLINERIREELRNGVAPSTAIAIGFDKAWATILDSNITTLIAGLALLAFGSGPIKGFAVVHCLGILTSMFSAVFFSRGVVNLWYGRKKKLQKISIGQIWRAKEK